MFPIRPAGQLDDERTWVVPIGASGSLSHPEGELAAEIAALAGGSEKAGSAAIAITMPARSRGRPRVELVSSLPFAYAERMVPAAVSV